MRAGLVALTIASASVAWAEGRADLRIHHIIPPLPRTLAMRPAAQPVSTAAPAQKPSLEEDDDGPSQTVAQRLKQSRRSAELGPTLSDQVVFNVMLGFGLDGGVESKAPLLNGSTLDDARSDYESLRSYGFGDVAIGTNGLGIQSLSSYLATRLRYNQSLARTYSVPSLYDGRDIQEVLIRSAYGEVDGFGDGLFAPLRFRAGRQFRYGPAIAHFDGFTLSYETSLLTVALYSGRRVSNLGFDLAGQVNEAGTLSGASVRLALAPLVKVPLVLSAEALRFDELSHIDSRLAYQFNRNNSILARLRFFGGKVARQGLLLRSRLSGVTTISADLQNRTRNDFTYDLLLTQPLDGDRTDARRYLSFGDVRPRTLFNVRAGTVLLRNIDLLLRGGFAVDRTNTTEQTRNTYAVGYAELGSALEVRMRRSVRLGASLLARTYRRDNTRISADPTDTMASPLIGETGAVGERNFLEGGITVRYSTGARRFTASAEAYGRQYWYRTPYDPEFERNADNRSGGRFSVEGWAGPWMRIRGEYDVARLPEFFASELRRAQTLRILTEGRF